MKRGIVLKRLLLLFLALSLLILGCSPDSNATLKGRITKNLPAYFTPDKYENLVEDPLFENGLGKWQITGDGKVSSAYKRYKGVGNSIRFTRSGTATYVIENVKEGQYAFRCFLHDRGKAGDTTISVYVNDEVVYSQKALTYWWWIEYASDLLFVPDKAQVKIVIDVKTEERIDLAIGEVQFLHIPYAIPEPVSAENPVSRLVKRSDGTYYMEIGGKPSLHRTVQVPDPSDAEYFENAVKNIKAAGFDSFTVWVKWKNIQRHSYDTEKFDFSLVQRIIDMANKHDMFVDIIWTGSHMCGNVNSAPVWIQYDHFLHSKDPETGECEKLNNSNSKNPIHDYCIADFGNETLLEYESAAISKLMDYLAENDTERRIVVIQIENEVSHTIYNSKRQTFEMAVKYINALAKIVKESKHPMITRVNNGMGNSASFIFNTPYIDINGPDTYSDGIALSDLMSGNTFNARVPHIAENEGVDNATSHNIVTFLKGGCMWIYPATYDHYHDKPGLFDDGFVWTEHTYKISNLFSAMAKIEGHYVKALHKNKVGFNYLTQTPSTAYNEIKYIDKVGVRMESSSNSAPVGTAMKEGKFVYCIADSECYFSVAGKVKKVTAGYFDDKDDWVVEQVIEAENTNGESRVKYRTGTAIRFELS